MSGIVSVERFSVTLAAGTASASANLTKSQTLANCVPFATHRVTTVASPVDDYSEYCIDVEMQSGPNRVTVTTSEGTTRALVVEITVVEFDATKVTVQSGTYQMSASASTTASVTAVVLANTFLVHGWQVSGNPATQEHAAVRGRFTSTTQLTFDRIGTTGTVDGHWYVIESDNADFTVQEISITLTAAASGTDTITSVTMNKTFLVGSYTLSSPADDNSLGSCEVVLTNATTVTVQRTGSTGNLTYTGYAISFAGLFTTIATLGLDGIVVRELVKDENKRNVLLGTSFVLKLIGAFVTLVLVAISVQFTNNTNSTNIFIFIIASSTVFQSFNVIDFYYQSKVLSKYVVYSNIISLLFSSILKISPLHHSYNSFSIKSGESSNQSLLPSNK